MGEYRVDDNYREFKRLFRYFKEDYPELWERGTTFEPYAYQEILIRIPTKGKLIYNSVGVDSGKIRWIEKYEKKEEVDRWNMYQRFLTEIAYYQDMAGITQVDISRITGISRQSINKYLSGVVCPKVSTMRLMAEKLGIDI